MTKQEALEIAKPIIFDTNMVFGIQKGTKTTTRLPVKPQPPKEADGVYERMDDGNFQLKLAGYEYSYDYEIKPPYQVGDILYVRETWAKISDWIDVDPEVGIFDGWIYRADWKDGEESPEWKPSIHMPKEAARIFLRVTDVRVERLQDITDEQAVKEGISPSRADYGIAIYTFSERWNGAVKKSDREKYGWDANPWVFVVTFERLEVTE